MTSSESIIQYRTSVRQIVALALIVWAASATVIFYRLPFAADDAYIHMRVARHLWSEGVPYFNVGDPVKASTATLWMLLLSLLVPVTRDLPWAVGLLSSLILGGGAVVWGLILAEQTAQARRSTMLLGVILSWGIMLPTSAALMETPLALLLVGLSYRSIMKGNYRAAAWGALAIFVRPECVIFLGLFALTIYLKESWRTAALFSARCVVIGLPLLIFEWHFFHTLYPHTAKVKAIVYPISEQATASDIFTAYFGHEVLPALILGGCLAAGFLFALLQRIGRPSMKSSPSIPCPLILGGIAIALLYVTHHTFIFPWYTPHLFIPLLVAGFGAPRVCGPGGWAITIGLLIPSVINLYTYLSKTTYIRATPDPFSARTMLYREIGSLLAKHLPSSRIMASEIGALGFEFPGLIIDSVGLASPQAVPSHPMRNPDHFGGVPPLFVRAEEPELIVGLNFQVEELLLTPDIATQYSTLYFSLTPGSNRYRQSTERPDDQLAIGLLMQSDTFGKAPAIDFVPKLRNLGLANE